MLCDPATAQTVVESTWVNPATQGYWGNAASWSPAAVPNNTGGTVYDVRVNVAAAKFAEQNTPNVTIRSLHKEGAGTLLLHERIRVENGGAFHEGVINLLGTNGRLEIYGGVFDWTGGTIQGLRHLHVSGDGFSVLRIAPATSVEMNAEIRNYGTVLWEAGDVTSIDFENILNYGIFHIRTDGQITRPVINQNGDGKILKSGPSDATLHASTGGHGSLEVVAGSLTLANGGGFSGPVRLGFRDLPVIVSPLAANATPGTEFSYQIETGAQVWVYGASGLPAGLSVNTETGLISGTIAESVNPGVYEVGLMVSDYNSTDAAKLLITVEENNPFVITSELWIAQEWNSYFNYEITTSQPANIRQAIGHEMAGLTFHGPSGTLSGTLQSPGVYFIDLFASNGAQSDFKTLELHVYFPGDPPPQPFSENELEVFANSPQMAPSSIPAARLVLGGNSTFQKFSGTGEFTLEADAELEVLPNATANIQHAGDLSGAILVRGTGALTMAGGTYSGVVEIEPTGSLAFTGAPNFSAGAGFRVDGTLDASALTNSWTMPTESQVLGGGTIQGNFVSTGQVGGGTAEDTLTIQGNAVLDGATLLVKTGASEDFVNSRIDVAGILNLTDANLEIEGDLETRTVIIANCETLEPGFSLSGLPDEYQVESLQDDDDGFNVALVPSDYLVWIVSHPSVPAHLRGRDDDADGDGVSNEQEFIDGTDPSNPDSFLPTIITQPQSIAVPGGGTGGQATLTVVANVGATPSYQWYYGETGDESNPVENANTASLTVGRVTAETNFWVKVSNVSDATHSVDSDTATISLVPGYFQDFDDLGAGIPIDWQVRTGATASSLGTPSTTYFPENGTWNASQGGFKSLASLTIDDDDAAPFDQHAWPDRALGIRQTADFGDPGAAFTFRLPDTIGKYDFHLSVDLMMLSVQSRSTTWSVEVGFGEAPTEFDLLTTYEDPGVFGLTQLDLSLQAITNLPHRDTPVWFRIVALNPSTGGGSRDTFAIDNFSLTWLETEPPTDLHLTNQSILENEPVGTVVGAFTSSSPITTEGFVYSLVPGVGNDDNANFSIVGSQLRTALDFDFETQTSHSIRVRTTQPDGAWLEEVFVITVLSTSHVVTTTADTGPGSLREAISKSNGVSASHQITFDPAVFDPAAGPHTITLESALPVILHSTQIIGPGADVLTITRNPQTEPFRILEVSNQDGPNADVVLSGVAISNGDAQNGLGGGILLRSGTHLIEDCIFVGNRAAFGAAIHSSGLYGQALTIRRSSFVENCASQKGGAIFYGTLNGFAQQHLLVENSTFSGNMAQSAGDDALYNQAGGPLVTTIVRYSTFHGAGSGFISNGSGTMDISHNIFSGSLAVSQSQGQVISLGYNISDVGGLVLDHATDLVGDAMLAELSVGADGMPVHLPLPGSPAIDAGDAESADLPESDQRGFARVGGAAPDIGAVEVLYDVSVAAGAPQTAAPGTRFGEPLTALVTEREIPVAGVPVEFTAPAEGASATFELGTVIALVETDGAGLAVSPILTANGDPGSYTVKAAIAGPFPPVEFSLNNSIDPPESGFFSWLQFHGIPLEEADATGPDGLAYLLKFAFNLEPDEPDVRHLIEDMVLPGAVGPLHGLPLRVLTEEGHLGLYYLQPVGASGITVRAEFHDDLTGIWTVQEAPAYVRTFADPDGDYELWYAEDPAKNPGPRRFGRVRVGLTENP